MSPTGQTAATDSSHTYPNDGAKSSGAENAASVLTQVQKPEPEANQSFFSRSAGELQTVPRSGSLSEQHDDCSHRELYAPGETLRDFAHAICKCVSPSLAQIMNMASSRPCSWCTSLMASSTHEPHGCSTAAWVVQPIECSPAAATVPTFSAGRAASITAADHRPLQVAMWRPDATALPPGLEACARGVCTHLDTGMQSRNTTRLVARNVQLVHQIAALDALGEASDTPCADDTPPGTPPSFQGSRCHFGAFAPSAARRALILPPDLTPLHPTSPFSPLLPQASLHPSSSLPAPILPLLLPRLPPHTVPAALLLSRCVQRGDAQGGDTERPTSPLGEG